MSNHELYEAFQAWDEINKNAASPEDLRYLEQDMSAWLRAATTRRQFIQLLEGSADYNKEGSSYAGVLETVRKEIRDLEASEGSESLLKTGKLFKPYYEQYIHLPCEGENAGD